ncbi:hypothetical protein [Dendrosporobacter sp. 1207_IL3150]|uniref:hypothetical protein n=1 Tax=Dendrosporobacter sp. 1207_IL3150 TaxID=3084054 RepID=UPI002FD9C2C2
MSKVLDMEEKKVDRVLELNSLLRQIACDLKAAVDLTLEVRRQSPQCKEETIHLWENFLGGLFGYIKQKSKESKDNLLSGISLTRMRFF